MEKVKQQAYAFQLI